MCVSTLPPPRPKKRALTILPIFGILPVRADDCAKLHVPDNSISGTFRDHYISMGVKVKTVIKLLNS